MTFNQAAIAILAVTVVITVIAEISRRIRLIYIFKPASTLIIIAIALAGAFGSGASPGTFGILVLAGLVFSFGGDVILMPPDSPKRFRGGLILFFIAHVLYIAAFWGSGGWMRPDLLVGLLMLGIGAAYYRLLWPKLGSMKISVALYILVISLMVSRAVSTSTTGIMAAGQAALVMAGAILFFISDLILSANRFWRPWRYERFSLLFYFGGQLCLALAVGG